jgi:very-short-patch-repair endonuclease
MIIKLLQRLVAVGVVDLIVNSRGENNKKHEDENRDSYLVNLGFTIFKVWKQICIP